MGMALPVTSLRSKDDGLVSNQQATSPSVIFVSFSSLNQRDHNEHETPEEEAMFLVGRDKDKCDLAIESWMIRDDTSYKVEQISRVHFVIFRKDGKAFLQSKSMNGTYVNGKNLVKGDEMELRSEARISVLSPDLEMFWYIDEKAMRENMRYPKEIVKQFVVGNIVGCGTFGKVRKGFLKSDGTPVALKFIDKNKLRWTYQWKEQDLLSIRSEVEILSKLSHACVTKLWHPGFLDTQEYLIIVMEFAEGGELDKQVKLDKTMGRINETTALIQFYQISHAIGYIHSKNICHRDLKLTNILMTQPEDPHCRLKISDFGISKIWSQENQLKTKVGSPMFMAPEVSNAVDGSPYTAKADCWALGIILYQLLSGDLPHDSQGSMEGKEWAWISSDAKNLVSKLLQPNPENRIESAHILHHVWFNRALHHQTVSFARCVMFGIEDSDPFQNQNQIKDHRWCVKFGIESQDQNKDQDQEQSDLSCYEGEHCDFGKSHKDPLSTPDAAKLDTNVNSNVKAMVLSKDEVMDAAAKALSRIQVNSVDRNQYQASESSSLEKDSLLQDSPDISVVYKRTKGTSNKFKSDFDFVYNCVIKGPSNTSSEQEISKTVQDHEEEVQPRQFDTLKSRLRPRNPVDYFKVNIVEPSTEPQHLHSPKSKLPNDKAVNGGQSVKRKKHAAGVKEVTFLLKDGGKRRRRYSEYALRISNQDYRGDEIRNSYRPPRQRRKSEI